MFPLSGINASPVLESLQARSDAMEIAWDIGRKLARDAMWHGEFCNWLSPTHDFFMGREVPAYGMLGPNLYAGTAGMGFFLSHLAILTDNNVIRETARGALRHALSRCEDDTPTHLRFGFHAGQTGIAYAAIVAGTVLNDESLQSDGNVILCKLLQAPVGESCILDVISGFAGAIPAILTLRNRFNIPIDLEILSLWGEMLVASSERNERGVSWNTKAEMIRNVREVNLPWEESNHLESPNLLGMAHGAGGIGLALLELAFETGNKHFSDIAEEAFSYEDSWYDAESMCWPDLRQHEVKNAHQTHVAWCHGAVGIALIRIRAWELTGNAVFRKQALDAMAITARALSAQLKSGVNFCLCHGIAGNAELFLEDTVGFGSPGLHLIQEVIQFGMDYYLRSGRPWYFGDSLATRVPVDLMTGLAGTGHFFLRLAASDVVPSILLLRT